MEKNDGAASLVRSDALLDAWDKRIDSLRERAQWQRNKGNVVAAAHMEGKANAYAKAHAELLLFVRFARASRVQPAEAFSAEQS